MRTGNLIRASSITDTSVLRDWTESSSEAARHSIYRVALRTRDTFGEIAHLSLSLSRLTFTIVHHCKMTDKRLGKGAVISNGEQ